MWLFLGFHDAPAGESVGSHVYKHVLKVDWVPSLGMSFHLGVDGMGVAMVLLTAITIFTGTMVSYRIETRVKEYYINLLALVTGVFGVFVSLDLFFYYFFYELAVIPMFLLIGAWGSTTKTVDQRYATMKLVLVLSAGAALALVGLIATYVEAGRILGHGTFDMVLLEQASLQFSTAFQMTWFWPVFLGFAALVPMWPLHSWSPAGHAAAPAAVSMLHAGVLMKLGAFGILRLALTWYPEAAHAYLPWVGVLCCMNILYGGLVAVAQRDMKLVIGYSSSSHMGYVLLGIASLTPLGLDGAVFLMFAHGVMTALAFSLIGFFYDQTHTRMLDDLGGMMKVMPFVGTCFVIACDGLGGPAGLRQLRQRADGDPGRLAEHDHLDQDPGDPRGLGPGRHGRLPPARRQGRLVRRAQPALEEPARRTHAHGARAVHPAGRACCCSSASGPAPCCR